MNLKEMKAMEGTEFTYVFKNGDTMPAYVKKFDIKTGKLSCWSFSLTTDNNHTVEPLNEDEAKEQACCVCIGTCREESEQKLQKIKNTGKWIATESTLIGNFHGCLF
jgi:hypothetical protein